MASYLTSQYAEVRGAVDQAARSAGRDPAEVGLLAVSKTFPVAAIREVYDCGQRAFAENKAQELAEKAPRLPDDIVWHFIGHLQGNKVQQVLRHAGWIHSVDSLKLLHRIDRLAGELGVRPVILLEVNLGGEENKTGAPWSALDELAAAAKGASHLDWRGLMGMAPLGADEAETRACFAKLRRRRDELSRSLEVALPALSIGMSGDYPWAIAEGATLVRIGTAIFGKRSRPGTDV